MKVCFTLILVGYVIIDWQSLAGLLLYNCESHLKSNFHS